MKINTEHLGRCIQTLESALEMLKRSEAKSIDYDVFRNAVVKGFELTLETTGQLLRKAIKPYLASSKAADRLYFKDLFRHGAKHGLLTLDEVERWFTYRENRNTTAHDYGEKFAEETLVLIPEFILDAKKLKQGIDRAET